MIGGFYKHNKSGRVYKVGGGIKVINTTNDQNKEMVMYIDPLKPLEIFVKENEEFNKEFTLIKMGN